MPEFWKESQYNKNKKNIEEILENPRIQKFIEHEGIEEKDLEIIEQLSNFPQNLLQEVKNFFNKKEEKKVLTEKLNQKIQTIEKVAEKTGNEYSRAILEEKTQFYKTLLTFFKKYNIIATNYLMQILNKIK